MTAVLHAGVQFTEPFDDVGVGAMTGVFPDLPFSRIVAGSPEAPRALLIAQSGGAKHGVAGTADGLLIVADVRLDNRAELLVAVGGRSDVSDADLLLEGYRRFGIDFAGRILGDGVFIVWDDVRRKLVAWRDVGGTRPLYFSGRPGDRLVVSSDLRSLTAHPAVPETLDLEYSAAFLRGGPEFHHPCRTLVAGALKVPAAHVLVADANGQRLVRYWTPGDTPERRHADDAGYVEELRDILRASVACRLGSSEVVGSHLSGGLDSSSVAVIAQRLLEPEGRRVLGLSWAPTFDVLAPIEVDERSLVEAVAGPERIDVRFSELAASDVFDLDTRDIAVRPATTMHFEIGASRAAAQQGATTILSGWGGDELVVNNGKGYFSDLARRGRWLTLHRELRSRGEIHDSRYLSQLRGRVVLPLLPDAVAYRLPMLDRLDSLELPSYLRPEFRSLLDTVEPLRIEQLRERPGVRRYQLAKLEYGHLQYRMEAWAALGVDIGVRYEYPLLDRRVMEFALGIPDHLYFRNGWKRWLYRTAMGGILPDSVRWYPNKQDSAMAMYAHRVQRSIRDRWHERLLEERNNPYMDVERYLRDVRAGLPSSAPGTARSSNALWLPFTEAALP